jgi:hypothetical protein
VLFEIVVLPLSREKKLKKSREKQAVLSIFMRNSKGKAKFIIIVGGFFSSFTIQVE